MSVAVANGGINKLTWELFLSTLLLQIQDKMTNARQISRGREQLLSNMRA